MSGTAGPPDAHPDAHRLSKRLVVLSVGAAGSLPVWFGMVNLTYLGLGRNNFTGMDCATTLEGQHCYLSQSKAIMNPHRQAKHMFCAHQLVGLCRLTSAPMVSLVESCWAGDLQQLSL